MIPPQAATELTAQHLVLVAQHGQLGVLGQRHAPCPTRDYQSRASQDFRGVLEDRKDRGPGGSFRR